MEAWRHGGIGMLICLLDEYKRARVDAWRGESACFASCAWSASTWLGLGLELGLGLGSGPRLGIGLASRLGSGLGLVIGLGLGLP